MRTLCILVVLTGFVSIGACFAADTPAKPNAAAAAGLEIATYSVPGIDKGAPVKDLVKALRGKPGIVSAKADRKAGQFKVTFQPGKANPRDVLNLLTNIDSRIKFVGVTAAGDKAQTGHDCGRCPHAASCGANN